MLPYFRSMEAFFNLSLPTDWQSLSDSQLQYFFTQLSDDLPMEEILTLCLFKWADLRVLCKTHDGSYLVKRRHKQKQEATLTIRQVQVATASLDFLRQFAPLPVRISKIRRATAIEADFQRVPFSTFISADNYYQGFLHTKDEALLNHLATLLYPMVKSRHLTTPLLLNTFYWFSSLKQYFSDCFHTSCSRFDFVYIYIENRRDKCVIYSLSLIYTIAHRITVFFDVRYMQIILNGISSD